MTSDLLTVLPMAIVMIAGPQIVSAIILATSDRARRSSIAFLLGVALAVTTGVTIAYVVASGVTDQHARGGGGDAVDYVIIGLLLILLFRIFLKRKDTSPPAWMGKLQTAKPRFAFTLGLLLFLLMPTDIITMITVGTHLGHHGSPWWHTLLFAALTVLLAGVPLILLLLLGQRGDVVLPKMRNWMQTNSVDRERDRHRVLPGHDDHGAELEESSNGTVQMSWRARRTAPTLLPEEQQADDPEPVEDDDRP